MFSLPFPPLSFGFTMLLAVLNILTTFTLTFCGLPATNQIQALLVLTVSLVPASRLKIEPTSLTKTNSAT
ncbi:MAG: hypothetical protein QGF59_24650 [Pirellulaceae bacterium]|nr:hypothetical protein [Pirellulaceae bacterium]